MTITDNTLGVGRLASVAWTPLDGTGLSGSALARINQQIDASEHVSDALLQAVKAAVHQGWSSFGLEALVDLGLLSTLPTGENSAAEWASFIHQWLGTTLSTQDRLGLNEWKRIAERMQGEAALQASKRNPSGGAVDRGGVTHANGQWYANGQALSLLDLFTAVRVNRLANYDDAIDGYVQELKENQRRLTAAHEWASTLRARRPPNATDTSSIPASLREDFISQWGFDPVETLTPSLSGQFGKSLKSNSWDIWLTEWKAFIDTTDTNNQILQGQIDQKSNRRSEALEAMTAFASKASKTGSLMASNLD